MLLGDDIDVEDLAARASAGDVDALGALFERYADVVVRACQARLGRQDPAAFDAAQETWVRVAGAIRSYRRERSGFEAWLGRIARNCAIDARRGARFRLEVPTADMLDLGRADPRDTPEEAALRADDAERILRAVRALPAKQRRCLLLRYWQGLTVDETARAIGLTPGNVRVLQHRAVRALRGTMPPVPRPRAAAVVVDARRQAAC